MTTFSNKLIKCLAILLLSTTAYASTDFSVIPAESGSTESSAIRVGNLAFITGQAGGDAANPDNTGKDIEEALDQIRVIANKLGGNMNNIIKLNIALSNYNTDFPLLSGVIVKYFRQPYPTRATIGVTNIPGNHTVEIDAVMRMP